MTKGRCPTCRAIATKEGNKLWPFCSERCQMVDLGRWLEEVYRIPDEQPEATSADAPAVLHQLQSDDD
jgi:endogenous inhibitor of DNA gyrase (YacG/DUF329 family)